MIKKVQYNQYQLGNDKAIVASAVYNVSSYYDGIYTKFLSGQSWDTIQDTFKMALPQSAWSVPDFITASDNSAALISAWSANGQSAIFATQYDTASAEIVSAAFPQLSASGRSTYVDGIPQQA